MAAQLSLNLEYTQPERKLRVRYEVPTYIKFYSLYQYDREKFRQLINEWLETKEGKNRTLQTLETKQNEILEKCFIRDKFGNKLLDSDEKHIYRYQTLGRITEQIYNYVKIYYMQNGIQQIDGLSVFPEDAQAELTSTLWGTPIKKRIKLHIRLLRLLRKGFNIKEALYEIKNA